MCKSEQLDVVRLITMGNPLSALGSCDGHRSFIIDGVDRPFIYMYQISDKTGCKSMIFLQSQEGVSCIRVSAQMHLVGLLTLGNNLSVLGSCGGQIFCNRHK